MSLFKIFCVRVCIVLKGLVCVCIKVYAAVNAICNLCVKDAWAGSLAVYGPASGDNTPLSSLLPPTVPLKEQGFMGMTNGKHCSASSHS